MARSWPRERGPLPEGYTAGEERIFSGKGIDRAAGPFWVGELAIDRIAVGLHEDSNATIWAAHYGHQIGRRWRIHSAIGVATINLELLIAAGRLRYDGYLRREETDALIIELASNRIALKETATAT